MLINQFEIWLADLNPHIGTEPGKIRPVLIVQSNLLNDAAHPSTVICPITTNVRKEASVLRLHLTAGLAHLQADSDVIIDQLRAIDNTRLLKKIGTLPLSLVAKIKENLSIILDLN